ncbi:hypothetical protein U1872_13985 [Sphingomonas sp. RB3P16]|uniref:hypothetical protein n=1 Tax=Parasphingomonas frigoris TaxID=3096163 RepID=UPI002FCA7CE5
MGAIDRSAGPQPVVGAAEVPSSVTSGMWACDLATEQLTWSDGVYDLFEVPRGTPLERAPTAARYTPESRIALDSLRLVAIRDKTGFTLDAEIAVASGTRWIRIVAEVECVDGKAARLVGSKTDVTHEKRAGLRGWS